MSRWTPAELEEYERRVGRPLLRPKEKVVAPVPTKYKAKAVESGGEHYQSKKEAARHAVLVREVAVGAIFDLHRHVTFKLAEKVKQAGEERTTPALRYEADFVYVRDGRLVVEDVKGMRTRVYKMKRHLMKTLHNIDIVET